MKEIIEILQEYGLSSNAAKTYITLLKSNPATGYEISSISGIPRSAIYPILNKLLNLGIINSVGDSPKKYIPLAPSSLIEHFNHTHQDRVGKLQSLLENMETDEEAFDFWHLHGHSNMITKCRELIGNAKEKLFLSAWEREINLLSSELKKAEENGIELTVFTFCKLDISFNNVVSYELDERKLREVWRPKLILVTDQKSTEIATNHIVLDITLAGQRLKFDPNPIVKRILKNPDLNLDHLID
jgi:sugar-specific transcriptional regulator TrmB